MSGTGQPTEREKSRWRRIALEALAIAAALTAVTAIARASTFQIPPEPQAEQPLTALNYHAVLFARGMRAWGQVWVPLILACISVVSATVALVISRWCRSSLRRALRGAVLITAVALVVWLTATWIG